MSKIGHFIGTFIIVVTTIYLLWHLISYSYSFKVIWYLGCAAFIGYIFAFLLLYLNGDWNFFDKKKKLFDIAFLISIFGIFIKLSPALVSSNFNNQINNYFGKSVPVDISNDFKNKKESYIIFAFDKTEYNDSPTIDANKDLIILYKKYIGQINRFSNNSFSVQKVVKYRDFFKAKLCSDLIKYKGINGKFKVLFVGGKTWAVFNNWNSFSDDNIVNAINTLFKKDEEDSETDLKLFWEKINDLVKDARNQEEYANYILYAYSDFIHDKYSDIYSDINDINSLREKLNDQNIIQNLFIAPYNVKESKNKKFILDNKKSLYEQRINVIAEIKCEEEDGKSMGNVKYAKIPLIYSENENSSPNFYFPDANYKIKIYKKNQDYVIVRLINDSTKKVSDLSLTTYTKLDTKGNYAIRFCGSSPKDNVFIDIARENIHVFFELQSNKNETSSGFMRFWIILIIFLMSFTTTIEILKRGVPFLLKKIKTLQNAQ